MLVEVRGCPPAGVRVLRQEETDIPAQRQVGRVNAPFLRLHALARTPTDGARPLTPGRPLGFTRSLKDMSVAAGNPSGHVQDHAGLLGPVDQPSRTENLPSHVLTCVASLWLAVLEADATCSKS